MIDVAVVTVARSESSFATGNADAQTVEANKATGRTEKNFILIN